MKKEKSSAMGTPYTFEGRIPLKQAIPLGLQHVMAMFIGNLTPLLIIMGACGLTADAGYGALRTALLQNAMTVAGIVTLVQMFSIGPIGGKVPIVMGTSSGFLGVFKSVTATYELQDKRFVFVVDADDSRAGTGRADVRRYPWCDNCRRSV